MEVLPKFVSLGGTALRLTGGKYYRDAGHWSVGCKLIEGELFSKDWGDDTPWLDKQPLIEITEEEWREDNGQYAPETP